MGHMPHFKYKHNFIQDTLVEQLIEQSPQHYYESCTVFAEYKNL